MDDKRKFIDVIWHTDELMVRVHPDGDLEFTENPKINTHFIRIDPDELTAFARSWLDQQGYDVNKREPEIDPCPNPECEDNGCFVIQEDAVSSNINLKDPKICWVTCPRCGYESPKEETTAEAIRLHNLIAGSE